MTEHRATERDHYNRAPAPWLAGSSDVGQRHGTNQDAFSLAVRPGPGRAAIVTVADGVSTAFGAEAASLVAAEAACDTLVAHLTAGGDPTEGFEAAFAAAQDAVLAARQAPEPSACTLIAGLITPEGLLVGNVGDSRAYWIGDDGTALLLSTDDSLAQVRIELGMTREEAEQSNQAHSITRWLGRDAADISPKLTSLAPQSSGWLLLCTDGLWNYASEPEQMFELLRSLAQSHPQPAQLSEALVAWANEQGGKDNITVVVARHDA